MRRLAGNPAAGRPWGIARPVFASYWADNDILVGGPEGTTLIDVSSVIMTANLRRSQRWIWRLLSCAWPIKGSRRRVSAATRAATLAATTTNSATIGPEPHPRRGPSMIAAVVEASSRATSTWPSGSRRRGRTALDSGTKRQVSAIVAIGQRIDAFVPKMAASLDEIHARSPQARVLVTGYGPYLKSGGCWPTQPWLAPDADYLQSKVDQIDQVIATQAAAHGAEYVDLLAPSAGHDACQASSARWVEGLIPSHPAAPLHPNAQGEAAYADIIGNQIAGS